eukprot:15442034-Alexandrium_andersonii.AAC.1
MYKYLRVLNGLLDDEGAPREHAFRADASVAIEEAHQVWQGGPLRDCHWRSASERERELPVKSVEP